MGRCGGFWGRACWSRVDVLTFLFFYLLIHNSDFQFFLFQFPISTFYFNFLLSTFYFPHREKLYFGIQRNVIHL